jgi:class 3 adenylate cyclase
MADSFSRFVPREFLRSLGRAQVVDIHLGESVEKVMTVLFSDIRGFTTLVERMSPTENISFVNSYIAHMEPVILAEGGFIDSYIGDAIMALFDVPAARAVGAALAMLGALDRFNQERAVTGGPAVHIGIGLNTGPLTLGTIGGAERLKCGVIGDTVNIAARVEGLTKRYGVPLLITGATHRDLPEAMRATARLVDHVRVAGSSEAVDLYEVFGADPARLRDGKSAAAGRWQEALDFYYARRFADASRAFSSLRDMDGLAGDLPAALFEERSRRLAMDPPGDEWTGVEVFREK